MVGVNTLQSVTDAASCLSHIHYPFLPGEPSPAARCTVLENTSAFLASLTDDKVLTRETYVQSCWGISRKAAVFFIKENR